MTRGVDIDGKRLLGRVDAFARIGATPGGGVDRQALTLGDRQARRLLADLARTRGFSVHQDAIANLFIRREGRDPDLPPILIGSHLDSQPTGGRFDGALGTLSAFEVIEALEDAGIQTRAPIEVVAWTNEEGSRFSPGAMGSMAFAGAADPAHWQALAGSDGAAFKDELAATLAALPGAAMRPVGTPVGSYLELHIEQGPSLEREGLHIGIVTAIQGTRWLTVIITGEPGHAGTTALAYRRDPMVAAVATLHDLQATVMPDDGDARLTVGRIEAAPGSINVIPRSVTFSLDIRHPDAGRLDAIVAKVKARCRLRCEEQRCTAEIRTSLDMAPTNFSPVMTGLIEQAAQNLRLPYKRMISGAFHDALFIARTAPAAMIFVPCRNGISHNEAEFVEPENTLAGARLLLAATLEAAGRAV